MSRLRLRNSKQQNEDVFKYYVNVHIHCENYLTVEAHMVVLAQHSPFCHKFFQSRKGIQVADMFFVTMKHSVVQMAIQIMYGKTVDTEEPDFKRVCSFLRMLQVDFEIAPLAQESNSDDVGTTSNISTVGVSSPFQTKTAQTNEQAYEVAESSLSPHTQEQDSAPVSDVGSLDRTFDSRVPDVTSAPQANMESDSMEIETDNWTVTTESLNRVFEIDHTVETSKTEKKSKYICRQCQEICFAFHKAEHHYFRRHLNVKPVIELIDKVERKLKSFYKEYQDLVEALKNHGNKILVQHEIE